MTEDTNLDEPTTPGDEKFIRAQRSIVLDPALPLHVKMLYTVLCAHANKKRICWPSRTTIAEEGGMSVSAVGRAINHAQKIGLLTVIRTQTSNRYQLHDFAGSYEPSESPGGPSDLLDRSVGPSGQVRGTHELDQRTRNKELDQNALQRDAASGATRTSSRGRRIIIKAAFWKFDNTHAVQYLVGAVLATLDRAGLIARHDAGDRMGTALENFLEAGNSRADAIKWVRQWAQVAGTDDTNGGWLASWPVAA